MKLEAIINILINLRFIFDMDLFDAVQVKLQNFLVKENL